MRTCTDAQNLAAALELPIERCCDSCHEDELEGYEMCWGGRNFDWYVCCAMLRVIEEVLP